MVEAWVDEIPEANLDTDGEETEEWDISRLVGLSNLVVRCFFVQPLNEDCFAKRQLVGIDNIQLL